MMVLLSKREYDALVQKASATDLLAEEKADAMKVKIKEDLLRACRESRYQNAHELALKLKEILAHY